MVNLKICNYESDILNTQVKQLLYLQGQYKLSRCFLPHSLTLTVIWLT